MADEPVNADQGLDPPEPPPAPPLPLSPPDDPPAVVEGERAAYLRGLSAKQELAILALLAEPTIAKAAEKADIGSRTLYRWLDDDRFSAAYRAARREAFAHAISLTQRYAPMAVQALAKIMSDPGAPASSRVSAATAVLSFARESIELDDLAARVAALEQRPGPALTAEAA